MGSVSRVFATRGSQFGAAVTAADEVTAPAPVPEANVSIPDSTIAVLMELPGSTPAEKEEWNDLVSERHVLNQRTATFITRQLAARHADLERRHEAAKRAVVEQDNVLEDLKKTLVEDNQQFVHADNARRLAANAAHNAEGEYKSLSRFSPKADIAAAEKRVIEANKKFEVTESKAAEWGQHLNYLKTVTIPAEQKKLTALIEAEMELAELRAGRDPFFAKFGFMQR